MILSVHFGEPFDEGFGDSIILAREILKCWL